MNKTLQQLQEQFSNAPITQREYMIEGRKYIVARHFAGDKDIDQVIREIAVNRARREFNI